MLEIFTRNVKAEYREQRSETGLPHNMKSGDLFWYQCSGQRLQIEFIACTAVDRYVFDCRTAGGYTKPVILSKQEVFALEKIE